MNKELNRSLLIASEDGNISEIKCALDQGADVNTKDSDDGWTALMHASKYGYVEIVDLLIKSGADVNAGSISNHTALMLASNFSHHEIMKILLDHGADVFAQDTYGGTALNSCKVKIDEIGIAMLESAIEHQALSSNINVDQTVDYNFF